jgi:hypothetical protein
MLVPKTNVPIFNQLLLFWLVENSVEVKNNVTCKKDESDNGAGAGLASNSL